MMKGLNLSFLVSFLTIDGLDQTDSSSLSFLTLICVTKMDICFIPCVREDRKPHF